MRKEKKMAKQRLKVNAKTRYKWWLLFWKDWRVDDDDPFETPVQYEASASLMTPGAIEQTTKMLMRSGHAPYCKLIPAWSRRNK